MVIPLTPETAWVNSFNGGIASIASIATGRVAAMRRDFINEKNGVTIERKCELLGANGVATLTALGMLTQAVNSLVPDAMPAAFDIPGGDLVPQADGRVVFVRA